MFQERDDVPGEVRKGVTMKAVCPKSKKHKRFVTTAWEVHNWVVDENGEFVRDMGCNEIGHRPDRDNIWNCKKCGAEAVFEDDGVAE